MKRLLLGVMMLGLVNTASSQDAVKFDAKTIMLELQKQILAPMATTCEQMRNYEGNSLKRTFVFRSGYFYDGMKEKIFLDFVSDLY